MTELEIRIKKAAQEYYTDGSSDLTDAEFDALVDELKISQPDSLLFRVGWGYDVSEDNTPGMKRNHIYTTIGSLDKCHNLKELGQDFLNIPIDVSTKLDGLSVVLYYENSLLKYALTRGDSKVGIDITDKILKINPKLAHTRLSFTGAIRGEILMSYTNFEKFKELHPEAKNPRNSTAGLINGKDTFEDLNYLNIVFYTLVHEDGLPITSVACSREEIAKLFYEGDIEIVPNFSIEFTGSCDKDEDNRIQDTLYKLRDYLYRDYPADGLVITQEGIGCIKGTYNYTAKAFKFPAESKVTEIIDIEWNMGKTKVAVPRIILKPIELSGTTVQACSGYNAQYIKENNLGTGSIVEVRKSGEIIPQIIKIHKSTEAKIPTHCPVCGKPLSWSGVHVVCTNPNCSNIVEQDLLIWLQNLAPVDNLGDTLKLKFLNLLIEEELLEDLSIENIMNSKLKFSEEFPSVQFNNFAKMWNKLHSNEEKVSLASAIVACNIPRFGDITAVKFANYPDKIQKMLDAKDMYPFSFDLMKDIGTANTESLDKHFNKFLRLNLIRDKIIWKTTTVESKGKVAITGKLSVKRSDFEKELRKYGYEPGEISKDTKFLVTDNPNSTSSKNKKADQWNITKITEGEFRSKYLR